MDLGLQQLLAVVIVLGGTIALAAFIVFKK